jgi:DinB superfamily
MLQCCFFPNRSGFVSVEQELTICAKRRLPTEELDTYRRGLLSALEGMTADLSRIVARVPPDAWLVASAADEPTPHSVLAHLCELEAHVFGPNLYCIVADSNPLLPPFKNKFWIATDYDPNRSPVLLLEEFSVLRKQEVTWLQVLTHESWSRTARHPWLGLHTLQWWVELQRDYSYQHLPILAGFSVL